jgi:hypothetical protein
MSDAVVRTGAVVSRSVVAEHAGIGRRATIGAANAVHPVLVGARTVSWNVSNTNFDGALTDSPAGRALSDLPYAEMIREHARWCETGGAQGTPSVFDGADLRALETIRGYNLTALSAKGAVFYALDMEGVHAGRTSRLRPAQLQSARATCARPGDAKLSSSDLREVDPLLLGRSHPGLRPARAPTEGADLTSAGVRNALVHKRRREPGPSPARSCARPLHRCHPLWRQRASTTSSGVGEPDTLGRRFLNRGPTRTHGTRLRAKASVFPARPAHVAAV